RQQDHDQAAGDAVGAVQQTGHLAGAAGGAGGVGVHAGGTHTGGASRVVWRVEAPTAHEATSSSATHSTQGLRAEPLVTRLVADHMAFAAGAKTGARPPLRRSARP